VVVDQVAVFIGENCDENSDEKSEKNLRKI